MHKYSLINVLSVGTKKFETEPNLMGWQRKVNQSKKWIDGKFASAIKG